MQIGWYPGHMNKARKHITQSLKIVDGIIEIVDARIPRSSENPMLHEIIGDKPLLKLLNKADLADADITSDWIEHYRNTGVDCEAVRKDQPGTIHEAVQRHFKAIRKRRPPTRLMIVGIPNVGKSTLLNIIADRKIAKVGNEPAVTKGQQEIYLSKDVCLIDTPGILWPKLEDQQAAYKLAITGAIKNTALEIEDIAIEAASIFAHYYPHRIKERFEIDVSGHTPQSLLEAMGRKRGCLRKGGVDFNKAGEMLLNEIRSGKLGRISLDQPASV